MASTYLPIHHIHPSVSIFAWPWRLFVMALLAALIIFLVVVSLTRRSLVAGVAAGCTVGVLALFFWVLVSLAR